MYEFRQLFETYNFITDEIGNAGNGFNSFIAYNSEHIVVVTEFDSDMKERQAACATFNSTSSNLEDIRSRYEGYARPGFAAVIDDEFSEELRCSTGLLNNNYTLAEVRQWLDREYRCVESWLSNSIYPLTVIADRYSGTYSGGAFVAFNCEPTFVPHGIYEDDDIAAETWHELRSAPGQVVYAVGNTLEESIQNLSKLISSTKETHYFSSAI